MTFRHIARVGAAGLFAAGILAAAAVPAYAAGVDFGVGFKGKTIAADASGKLGFVTIANDSSSSTPAESAPALRLQQARPVQGNPGAGHPGPRRLYGRRRRHRLRGFRGGDPRSG